MRVRPRSLTGKMAAMATYRIHRMKDVPRQQFRFAPHVSGAATVRLKDYQPEGEVEAENEYDAWARLRATDQPLQVGDLLEAGSGELRICKYVGFETAQWHVPEVKVPVDSAPPAGPPEAPPQAQA
jgi:hypothetical protein